MNTEAEQNRRAFHRIFFDAPVVIHSNDKQINSQLIDISLNGALIRQPENWDCQTGTNVSIEIRLSEEEPVISMEARVAHIENERVGLQRIHVDMDSITHLRRLVELNLGDNELLHRDLSRLSTPN